MCNIIKCTINSHKILYEGKWIRVDEHPDAILVTSYLEPYLYCLNTTHKNIIVCEYIFSYDSSIFL
jgi:hypothetical protein